MTPKVLFWTWIKRVTYCPFSQERSGEANQLSSTREGDGHPVQQEPSIDREENQRLVPHVVFGPVSLLSPHNNTMRWKPA